MKFLPEVEDFTINELIPAIAKGGFISDSEKNKIAEQIFTILLWLSG